MEKVGTTHTEITVVRCFLCRRRTSGVRGQKFIDSGICPVSKKTVREVLSHVAQHMKIELHIPRGECICLSCHGELVEYDATLMRALQKQRLLSQLIERAVVSVEFDFEEECDVHMKSLEELTDDHCFDDALISDSEIAQAMEEAVADTDSKHVNTGSRQQQRQERDLIQCNLCAMKFKSKTRLQSHLSKVHKKFCCELCSFSHRNEDYVVLHMNTHEGRNENQCRFCNKEFTTKISTIRHMEVHYNAKKYQCDKCGLCFSQTTVLYNHKLQHEAEEQPLQCTICNQVFKTKRTFRHHMITHRADRPRYNCEYCSKTFTEKYTLKVHRRTHPEAIQAGASQQDQQQQQQQQQQQRQIGSSEASVEQSVESKFNCIICDQFFSNKEHLNRHMEKEHDVILKSLTLTNFTQYEVVTNEAKKPCHICGHMFSAQPNLDYHLQHVHGVSKYN